MAKIIYEFDTTSDLFDPQELKRVQNAYEMSRVIEEIMEQIRQWYKYDTRPSIPTEEVRDTILEIINNRVNIDELL